VALRLTCLLAREPVRLERESEQPLHARRDPVRDGVDGLFPGLEPFPVLFVVGHETTLPDPATKLVDVAFASFHAPAQIDLVAHDLIVRPHEIDDSFDTRQVRRLHPVETLLNRRFESLETLHDNSALLDRLHLENRELAVGFVDPSSELASDQVQTLVRLFQTLVGLIQTLVHLTQTLVGLIQMLVGLIQMLVRLIQTLVRLIQTLIRLLARLADVDQHPEDLFVACHDHLHCSGTAADADSIFDAGFMTS
jgi:hypothetical protein